MKFLATLFCLALGGFSSTVEALTFRLNPEMNLLVLDGHKLPGSLLKGADSIELDRGQHQILFTLEHQHNTPAVIITFTAQSQAVSVVIPPVSAPGTPPRKITRETRFRVVDENNRELPAVQDFLDLQPGIDYVTEMTAYNSLKRKASVEKFASNGLQGNILPDRASGENVNQSHRFTTELLTFSGRSIQSLVLWFRDFRTS